MLTPCLDHFIGRYGEMKKPDGQSPYSRSVLQRVRKAKQAKIGRELGRSEETEWQCKICSKRFLPDNQSTEPYDSFSALFDHVAMFHRVKMSNLKKTKDKLVLKAGEQVIGFAWE